MQQGQTESVLQADVALDVPGQPPFSYAVPAGWDAPSPGTCVAVPFGAGERIGFVLGCERRAPPQRYALKSLERIIAEVVLPPSVLALARWGARYYRCSVGEFLCGVVPAAVRDEVRSEPTVLVQRVDHQPDVGLTARQREVAAQVPAVPTPLAQVLVSIGCSRGVIDRLVAAGAVIRSEQRPDREVRLEARHERHVLTDEQSTAVLAISAALQARRHETFLLYGVTGSGKTLVYLDLAEQVIASGKQVLFLLPEIGLTPQLAARVRTRFPEVVVWHSAQADGDRAESWRRCARGEVPLVIGTRSSLFAPLPNVGLIIVDEEHDPSYKQESTPRYHARDLAVVYGQQCGIPVVLGSATPALETVANGRAKRFTVLTLRNRPRGGTLPDPVLVDMREECREQRCAAVLSRELVNRLHRLVPQGEQAILLLNRRGWSPVVSCVECGVATMCSSCDIALTWHRAANVLRCHYCGHQRPYPTACNACGSTKLSTSGLGTEQLAATVQAAVPGARILRVDADTVGERQGHAKLFAAFARGEADILVGTQMVAKGLDFPRVTLVGVLNADKGLAVPEFRAAERTWQLIAQVAGRAGRGDRPGTVVVQAYDVNALPIRCALEHRPKTFIDAELLSREAHGYPPSSALVHLLWAGKSQAAVQQVASEHGQRIAAVLDGGVMLGPNPAELAFLKDHHRWHALLKCASRGAAQALLDRLDAAGGLTASRGVTVTIDVDPMTTT